MTVTGKKYQNLNHLNLTITLSNHFIISQIEELANLTITLFNHFIITQIEELAKPHKSQVETPEKHSTVETSAR
jgi:hypothetical protein